MSYQIYRLGEWVRVGGVGGYSTMRAYVQPNVYETKACALAIAGRLAEYDYEHGGDGGFVVVPYGASPFDNKARVFNERRWADLECPF